MNIIEELWLNLYGVFYFSGVELEGYSVKLCDV